MSDGAQIDYEALAKQAGAIGSKPASMDYAALAKQAGATDSQPPPAATMAPGSYQSRRGGPILNANDSALHSGIVGVQHSLGVTKPPESLTDEFSQIGSGLKKFAGRSWDELQKATGEERGTRNARTRNSVHGCALRSARHRSRD